MKKSLLSLVIMASGFGSLSHALSIDPKSVHPVVDGKVYRGGVTEKKAYGKPITDFSYACENNFTMVVNAYSKDKAKPIKCPDGRTLTYLGDHWSGAEPTAADATIAEEIVQSGKVLVHCVHGVDASQQIAYIVAAKAGLMTAEVAAAKFAKTKGGVPHAGKMEGYVLKRGQR